MGRDRNIETMCSFEGGRECTKFYRDELARKKA